MTMRVNFEFDSADEFTSIFAAPARELAESRTHAEKGWDKFYAEEQKRYDLESQNNALRAQLAPIGAVNISGTMGEQQVRALLTATHAGQKIQAIKIIREMFHLGLKESKDLVEDCAAKGIEAASARHY
jgi:ribosomal protein L7/L12